MHERAHLGSRVGLTAGRVLGNAVERNRIKRRIRAAVRQHRLELTASVDVILHPRRTVLEAEFAAIEGEVQQALRTVQAAAETAERTGCELPGKPPRERAKPKAASGKDGEAKEPSDTPREDLRQARRQIGSRQFPPCELKSSAARIASRRWRQHINAGFRRRSTRWEGTLLPMRGGCRYQPTCSEYAAVAIARHGWGKGMAMAAARLLRCHPWSKGGFDPVP